MATAKVFKSGNSQAVRLPKQFHLKGEEVDIFWRGNEIILREHRGTMARAFDLLAALPNDLTLAGRRKDSHINTKGCDGRALYAGYQHLHLHPAKKQRKCCGAGAGAGASRAGLAGDGGRIVWSCGCRSSILFLPRSGKLTQAGPLVTWVEWRSWSYRQGRP